jgi:hypothetical protein
MEMDKVADLRITSIQIQKNSVKPNDLNPLRRNGHSNVSNALVTSIFKAMLPPKALECNKLAASEARHRQSLMFLP